jgi:hypothetical protein
MAKKKKTEPMTPAEFYRRMKEIRDRDASGADHEGNHAAADDLMEEALRSLGYGRGCALLDDITRWYA